MLWSLRVVRRFLFEIVRPCNNFICSARLFLREGGSSAEVQGRRDAAIGGIETQFFFFLQG